MTPQKLQEYQRQSIIIILLLACALCWSLQAADNSYRLLEELPIGESTGWNALSVNETTRCLYGITSSTFFVVNLDTEQVVRQQTNVVDVSSFAVIPRYKMGFCLKTKESKISMVDLETFKHRGEIKTGSHPEIMLVEPTGISYTFNTGDNTVTAFEADDGDLMGNTPLPGTPRAAVLDAKSRRVFCAIEDQNQIAFFKFGRLRDMDTWSTLPGEKPSGLALDATSQRLLVGCGNGKLVMMDMTNGKVVDTVELDSGVVKLAYDPELKLVYAAGNQGVITMLHLDLPQKLTIQGKIELPSGCSCLALDAKTHKLYVGGADSKIRVYAPGKP